METEATWGMLAGQELSAPQMLPGPFRWRSPGCDSQVARGVLLEGAGEKGGIPSPACRVGWWFGRCSAPRPAQTTGLRIHSSPPVPLRAIHAPRLRPQLCDSAPVPGPQSGLPPAPPRRPRPAPGKRVSALEGAP